MADQDARNEFDAAVAAAAKNPADLQVWDRIEELTEELNCPDQVAALYKDVLAQELPKNLILGLGERAANFLEEWFGDDPTALQDVLVRVLQVEPDAEWAFQRITVVFSVTERWDDMLRLYDQALTAANGEGRRIQLLEEAAQVAKDVANQPDKAIAYLQQLVPLKPNDAQLESSLERLLERHERWADLIALWESQLSGQTAEEREQNRARIAACWLDNLHDPARALEAIKPLLAEAQDDGPACALLERIVTDSEADSTVRGSALDQLRMHYESTERPREIVRVLEAAIELAEPQESMALREEAGSRLAALDDDLAAMDHYAALLALNPSLSVIQEKMHQLARRSSNFARYADGIATAAEACQNVPRKVALLAEAARIRLDMLEDEEGAIRFYQAALAQEGLEHDEERRVARRLAELLGRADRPRERLDVLERLARTDPSPSSRRTVIGEAARLAESLDETDRALTLWKSRIDADGDDLFAIDATIALLENSQRWHPLIEMLDLRVKKTASELQLRADLMRIATIYDRELVAPDQAIQAWLRVTSECGENAETLDALADLYARTEQWQNLAELLERTQSSETARVSEHLVGLADAYRLHLAAPDQALTGYTNALAIESTHAGARAGMTALLDVDPCRAVAAESLATAYRRNGEWAELLGLLEPRLADAADARERLSILRDAAEIQEQRLGDSAAALASLARAFPLAPTDRSLEGQLTRLAAYTGEWAPVSEAFDQAARAVAEDSYQVARLRLEQGDILETRLDRSEDAYVAYRAVRDIEPGNLDAVGAMVRLGTRLGHWDQVAVAVLQWMCEQRRIEPDLLREIETVATEDEALASAAQALSGALDQTVAQGDALPPRLVFELYQILALWHRDLRNDPDAAMISLTKALTFDRERVDALRDLAALQRPTPGKDLFETLRRLAEVETADLDVAKEAADIALGHLPTASDVRGALNTLLSRATAAWRGTIQPIATDVPENYVSWAIEGLVDHYLSNGTAAAAVDLLIDSARLPFTAPVQRAMRHRAASIALDKLGDKAVAIQMYQALLAQAPEDVEAIEKLAALYQSEGRVAEKLALRKHQLNLPQSADQRIELRLEIATLVGHIEEQGGRLEALQANLADHPGHPASIDALQALLEAKGEYTRLADILEAQATALQDAGNTAAAASVWARVAPVVETHTREAERAIHAYRRVVDLATTPEALRALARLFMDRDQPAQAVPWFENLLAGAAPDERPALVLELAQAHLGAGNTERAIACLESNISDRVPALELRALLADLYREKHNWEPLARFLTRSLPLVEDNDTAIAYAREAADIYSNILKSPDKAIPALEKALSIVSGDRTLRAQLAMGLREDGRLYEAEEILNELIGEFGRRRSAERAALHVEMARVKKAQGHDSEALAQMEQAAKMDVGNVRIQKQLAEMARSTGQLGKAERTYRALLLVVRRQPPGDDIDAVGASEVLFELHKLAAEQAQEEQAKELLETALETAVQSDAEVRRLRRSLLAHSEPRILLRVLEMRLDASDDSAGQADLLADMAEVFSTHLKRPNDAMDAMIKALQKDPARMDLHQAARNIAREVGKSAIYVDSVKTIADNLRRKEDSPLVAKQFMYAGEALEHDLGDLESALELYKRVEELGESTAEAYFAIARVCGGLGKTDEQARVLESMLKLATAEEPSAEQIDALYRLAEIFIGTEDRREQGIDLLEKAFSAEPRYTQAGVSLKVAALAEPDNERVMALYERVARSANDWNMLLDFLERRAQRSDATPNQVREAVDVALDHGETARAEALLDRAVDAARTSAEGVSGAVWAMIGLAETRIASGDFAAARNLIHEVSEYAEPDKFTELVLDLAKRAVAADKSLAAEMYELLRERSPSDRAVWEPLMELYRNLSDGDRLQEIVAATLPTLVDPDERNALRMQQARYLIEKLERYQDAIDIMRDVLLDDPDHAEAGTMLEDVLRQHGDDEALADFLWQRFEESKSRGNPEAVIELAQRLGALLDQLGSTDAITVYRGALEVAPESPDLVRAVLDHLGPEDDARERAELIEQLIAIDTPENAVNLAVELVSLYEQLDDVDGVQRALERAYQANPDSVELRDRLESWYRERENWVPLADLMTEDAQRLAQDSTQANAAVARLREAASVHRDLLGDPGAAAGILRRALTLAPTNDHLVAELAACLTASGDPSMAVAAISEALESTNGDGHHIEGESRVDLLLLRSDLRLQLDDEASGLRDLEEAYEIAPDRIRPQLIDALERSRQAAGASGDIDTERQVVMRLASLLAAMGERERGRGLLMEWVDKQPQDQEPLRTLLDMDKADENWDGVLEICTRLVHIDTGAAQVQAAVDLAEAAEKAERPGDALQALEMVHQAQPESSEIRDRLRRIYELSGSFGQLAEVLLADGDHAEDEQVRYDSYRRAAEVMLYSLGDAVAAAAPASKAYALRSDDHDATVLYVDILTMGGQTDEAIALLEEAIAGHKRRSPQLAALQQRMARIAAVLGDQENQLAWLRKAFDVDRKNGEIAAELAQLATEIGDYDLALKPLRAITLMENPGPITRVMALLWEAKIEHARGNRAKAELWAKKALREDPEFNEAKEFLAQIS